MEQRRFVLFLVLSFAILIGYYSIVGRRQPKLRQPQPKQRQAEQPGGEGDPQKKKTEDKPGEEPPKPDEKGVEIVAAELGTPQYVTLGSADPDDPFRMLVTLSSKGACVKRIELNSPRYRELDDRSGYLGNLIVNQEDPHPDVSQPGCPVQVVGRGTPAYKAGLKPGDVITAIGDQPVAGAKSLTEKLEKTRPNQEIELTVLRPKDNDNKAEKEYTKLTLSVTLGHHPLQLIRPAKYGKVPGEEHPSFLLTLHRLDGKELDRPEDTVDPGSELPGLHLWDGNWVLQQGEDKNGNPQVVFSRVIKESDQSPLLKIIKTYRLKKVPAESIDESNFPAYNLEFEIEIRNMGDKAHEVAYQLVDTAGLVAEGIW